MVEHQADSSGAKVNEVEVKASAFPVESVSLYSVGGRAELKRNLTVQLKEGQNEVKIVDMSSYLIEDSISVSGSGEEAHAVIHSVTVSQRSYSPPTTSDKLKELKKEEKTLVDLVEIKKSAYNGLVKYAESLSTEHVKSATLAENLNMIEKQMQERATAKRDLDEKIRLLAKDIADEEDRLASDEQSNLLGNVLRIAVAADADGEITLELKYAVSGTSWRPSYVLRVSTETSKVKLGYKAIIQQETGEAWNNIALTLETSQPTQGLELPVLYPQRLSFFKPLAQTYAAFSSPAPRGASMAPMSSAAYGGAPAPPPPPAPMARMKVAVAHAEASVQSTGASTSFTVPGRPSIPPDGTERNVTIAELDLDVTLSRAAVPKRSTLCHLRAQIRNTSQYILLSGPANVTLDGAFVAKTRISTVHPSETFTCALGADASIRITTSSPLSHASTESSFFGVSTTSKTLVRRIDVKNVAKTGRTVIVFDQVPVAEANKIAVECLTPALGTPPSLTSSKEKEKEGGANAAAEVVRVGKTVKARWAYVHEGSQLENEGEEVDGQGEKEVKRAKKEVNTEGRVRWEVELAAGESTAIELVYKVTWPADERLVGL